MGFNLGLYIVGQSANWAINQILDAIFHSIQEAEKDITSLKEGPLHSGKDYIDKARAYTNNGNLAQAKKNIEKARDKFHDAASQNANPIKLISYCYAGLCEGLLEDQTGKNVYYTKALEEIKQIEQKNQEIEKILETTKEFRKGTIINKAIKSIYIPLLPITLIVFLIEIGLIKKAEDYLEKEKILEYLPCFNCTLEQLKGFLLQEGVDRRFVSPGAR